MKYDCIVVDCYNMAYRQWWHVKDLSYNGVPTGLEFGFIKKIMSYLKSDPGKVYLAWDGKPSRCQALVEAYKSGRVKVNGDEPDWSVRLERLRVAFANLCHTLYHENEEADEQIAKFVIANPNKRILIASNDKDLQQLVNSFVHIEGSNGILDSTICTSQWGIPPYKIPLYKAIDGDKSDNIPGVPRLLTKTKIKLVSMSETIDDLVANFNHPDLTQKERDKLSNFKDRVVLNYQIVNLLGLEGDPNLTQPDGDKTSLQEIIRELNFTSIFVD